MLRKLFVFLFVLMCIPIMLQAQPVVQLDENFNSVSPSQLPTGWVSSGDIATSYNWLVATPTSTEIYDGKALRMRNYSEGDSAIIKTPVFDLSVNSSLTFMTYNSSCRELKVYLLYTLNSVEHKELLVECPNTTEWVEYAINLHAYTGATNARIVFQAISSYMLNSKTNSYIDDVKVFETPLCARPIDLAIGSLTKNSASLQWNFYVLGNPTDNFRITMRDADGNNIYNNTSFSTTGNNIYNMSGLTPNTEYTVILQGDCSASAQGYSDQSAEFTFNTPDNAIALPYSTSFENLTDLPAGWLIGTGRSSSDYSYSYTANTGDNSLMLSSKGNTISVIAPAFAAPSDSVEVDFSVQATKATTVRVGWVNDVADLSTFNEIFSYNVNTLSQWINLRFNTSGSLYAKTQGLNLCFLLSSESGTSMYIDDVNVRYIASCSRLEQITLNQDSTNIEVSWIEYSTTPSANYQVEYVNNTAGTTNYINVTTNPYTLSGLNDNSDYTIRVRSICTVGDTSEWSLPVSTHTFCRPRSAILYEDFAGQSSFDDCWTSKQTVLGTGTSYSDYGSAGWDTYSYSGKIRARLRYAKEGGHYILATPALSIGTPGQYDLKFSLYRFSSSKTGHELKVWASHTTDTTDAVLITTIARNWQGYPEGDATGWYQYEMNIPLSGSVHILFEGIHGASSSTSYLDSISIYEAPACREAKKLQMSSTVNTIDLSWTPGETFHNAWKVTYTLYWGENDSLVYNGVVNTPSYSVPNLDPATAYHIVGCVYTQCNDTLLSAPLEFDEFISTECYTINTFPYVQNFEQTEVIPPVCWNRYLIKAPTSGTNFKEDSWTLLENESLAHSGSGAAMFQKCGYQTVATLVTPKFNFEAGKRYQLRFWMYRDELTASYKTNLRAFVTTNSSDTIGYRLCDIGVNTAESPAEVSKGYYEYIFEIPDTISGERYIVLAGLSLYYSYTTIYIDDVVVEEVPACQKIQRVHSSVISYSTANLWVETEENVNWQYVVLKGEETIESATPISVVGSDSTIVTGLDPDTEYRFYVRRDCGNGSYSEWSANVSTLTTPCMEGRAPYLETFESYTKGIEIINACFDFQRPSTYYKYPVIANSALDNEPYAGKQCVYAAHKGYLFRQFYFEAGKTYEVSVYATGANDDEATGYGDRITFFLSSSPASSGIITNFSTNNPVKSGWNRISATFTVPDPGYYYLGIEFVTNYGLGIDNLSVREIECLEPNNMSFSSITTTSAELMFLQNGVQTEVRVSSVDNGDLDPAFDILIDTISNNTIQITGLQPSTKYYYTLRSICANGSRSSWTTISSFYTLCESVSVPYSDGFEEGNTNFTCWSSMGLNKTAELSDSKHHRQGNSSVLLQNTTFTSPELNVNSLAGYTFTGYVLATNANTTISFGVQGDPNASDSYEHLYEFTVPIANSWTEFNIDLSVLASDDYTGDPVADYKFIAMVVGENEVYLDNINIIPTTNCSKPSNITINNFDPNNLNITWTAGGSEQEWEVKTYRIRTLANGDINNVLEATDTVQTSSITLSNLYPTTTYYVVVSSLCGTGDRSLGAYSAEFETGCATMSLPYNANIMSNANAGIMPNCWSQGDYSPALLSNVWGSTRLEGLTWYYNSMSAIAYSTIITPKFDFTNVISANITMSVNVMNTDTMFIFASYDGGLTFTDTVGFMNPSSGSASEVRVIDASNCAGREVMFAIRAQIIDANESECYAQIRQFEIEPVEACLIPAGAIVGAQTGTTAKVVINDTIDSHNTWDYVVVPAGDRVSDVAPTTVHSKVFELTGLNGGSDYDLYVRTNCGNDNVSSWRGPVNFGTKCSVITIPYHEGFENEEACYQLYKPADASALYPSVSRVSDYYYYEGNYALKFVSASELISVGNCYFVLPQTNLRIQQLGISFNYIQRPNSGQLIIGIMNGNDTASFIPYHTLDYTEYYDYNSVDFKFNAVPAEYADYRVAVAFTVGFNYNNASYIDNILVYQTDEFKPVTGINVKALTTTTATVGLDYTSDYIEVSCVAQGNTPNETGNLISTTNEVTITGLTPATCYAVYARTHSGSEVSEWFGPTYFYTECGIIDVTNGWTENFDSYTNPDYQMAPCITLAQTAKVNGEEYPKVMSSTISTLPNAMVMRGTNTLVLPEFNYLPGQLEFSCYMIGNDCDVVLGTIQDGDITTFNELEYLSVNGAPEKFTVNLSGYYCSGNRIALRTKMSSSIVYIDSIHVCIPNVTPVVNITNITVTDSEATISWNAPALSVSTAYSLYNAADTNVPLQIGTTTNGMVTFSGLTSNTSYVIELRAELAGGQFTPTVSANFTTNHPIAQIPAMFDFENDAENSAWEIITNKNDRFIFGSNATAVKTGDKALYVSNKPSTGAYGYTREACYTYACRKMYLPAGMLDVSFDYYVRGYLSSDFGRVFLMPIDAEMPSTSLSYGLPDGSIALDGNSTLSQTDGWANKTLQVRNNVAGYYYLVVYWWVSGYYEYQPPISVDNISISAVPCAEIENVSVSTTSSGAVISYTGYVNGSTIHYVVTEDGDTVANGTVNGNSINITGLEPQTTYEYELYATCTEGTTPSIYGEFNTGCLPLAAPWSYGFEDITGDAVLKEANPCWSEISTTNTYHFTGSVGMGTNNFDVIHRTGSQSLFYYSGINTKSIICNTFHFEAGKVYKFSGWARTSDNLTKGNTISVVRIVNNLVAETYATIEVTEIWQNISAEIMMSTTGDYQIGLCVLHNTVDEYSEYYMPNTTIDDLEFVEVVNVTPQPVTVTNINANGATIGWRDVSDSYVVDITRNNVKLQSNIVSNINSYDVTGLYPNTTYQVSVRGINGNDTTNAATATFTTDCGAISMPYQEDFEYLPTASIPSCWDNIDNSVLASGSSNWGVSSVDGSKVMNLNTASSNGLMEIHTMPININNANAALTFRYNNGSDQSKLYVMLSNDGGATVDTILSTSKNSGWKEFSYNLGNYMNQDVIVYFSSISSTNVSANISFDDFRINAMEYMPVVYDTICQGEPYYRNGFSYTPTELNVGNNTLSTIKTSVAENAIDTIISVELVVAPKYFISLYDTICKGDVYNKGLFANVTPAITSTGRYERNFISSFGCDSTVALYLTVLDFDKTIDVALCEGDTYTYNGTNYTDAGTYTISEQNPRGCNATTTININIIPKYYDVVVMRCDNDSYVWEGRTITTTGVYTANYTNVNGCDSIMRLYYTALPTQVDTTIAICRGSDYDFAGTTLTEPGTYNNSFVSTFGCDSVVNLTLVVTDPTRTVVNDYVCEGDDYNGNGFNLTGVTADTIAELTLQTYAGCDSIIELHLTLIPAVYDTIYASINPGETYEFANNTYTQAGEYEGHFFTEGFGCDSLVTLILSVGTSVESSYALPIVVAPNPVLGGQSTYLTHEWTAEEQSGMRVEVLNSVGQLIEVFTPATYPIEVKGINVSGIYVIRVTSGTGNVYIGRLVVK